MLKRIVKVSGVLMGIFSIFALVQDNNFKSLKKQAKDEIDIEPGEVSGDESEGIILFDLR